MERERKTLFGKEYGQLRQQITHTRKDSVTSIRQLAGAVERENPDISDNLRRLCDKPAALSYATDNDKRDNVQPLTSRISAISGLLKKANNGRDPDIRELKDSLRSINENIYQSKVTNDQRYNQLKNDESVRSRELDHLRRESIFLSETTPHPPAKTANPQETASADATKPKAVVEFDRYCAEKGGTTGGWDNYDHNEFLSFRFRHGPYDEHLAEKATLLIPTRTPEDILQHEEWYCTYSLLDDARKEAVTGWRRGQREQQRQTSQQLADKEKAQQAADNESRKVTQDKQRQLVQAHQEVKAKQIAEKTAKDAQVSMQHEQEARKRFLDHQNKLKTRLDSHYRHIDDQLTHLQLDEERKLDEAKQRRQTATIQAMELGARTVSSAADRAQAKRHADATRAAAQERHEQRAAELRRQASRNVSADPQRLSQHTDAWNRRLDAQSGDGDPSVSSWRADSIFNLPKLKLPEWRRSQDLHL